MSKFFVDACLPISSADTLRRSGIDAVHAREVSLGDVEDSLIIEFARNENRILVTRDRGFGNIHKYPIGSHEGIIVLRLPSTYTAGQINSKIGELLEKVELEKIRNRLLIVEPDKIRVRSS